MMMFQNWGGGGQWGQGSTNSMPPMHTNSMLPMHTIVSTIASSTASVPSGTVPNTVSSPSHPSQENQIQNNQGRKQR